jgi:hypothetical protein
LGVGEAGLATALARRRFGLLGAGDTISTNTRGSRETVDGTVFLVETFLRSSSSSDRSSSSRSIKRAPLGGLEWTAADALDWERVKRLSLFFLVGVETAAGSGAGFRAGLRTLDGEGREACTARDVGFRDGDESGELATVERVRRLVGVGSSTF